MAQSPSHKFGQKIGDLLEGLIQSRLTDIANKHNVYLDYKNRSRNARRGKKVSWEDSYGNKHDLDYVFESGGKDTIIGKPVAFVEVAWRRYTKHSRAKAQEIEGAVLPVAEKYDFAPFLGVVAAGNFTSRSLEQLQSRGFELAYFPYETFISAFGRVDVDIEFDETTPDSQYSVAIEQIDNLPDSQFRDLERHILSLNSAILDTFMRELDNHLSRRVESIIVIPLYGNPREFVCARDALRFIEEPMEGNPVGEFQRFEVIVKYSNGESIEGNFKNRNKVRAFIRRNVDT